jgi:uncharacterized membrane protein
MFMLVLAAETPGPKDLVLAMLGASAGLAGLILVFLGQVIASYQALPGGTPQAVKDRRKRAAPPVILVFALSLVSVTLCLAWLAVPGGSTLYHVSLWVFAVDLLATFSVAVSTTLRMLR